MISDLKGRKKAWVHTAAALLFLGVSGECVFFIWTLEDGEFLAVALPFCIVSSVFHFIHAVNHFRQRDSRAEGEE